MKSVEAAAMKYRRLSVQLARYLESSDCKLDWPPYRALKTYSIRNGWAFSEREYAKLRVIHAGLDELVASLVSFLGDFQRERLVGAIPELETTDRTQWLDCLSDKCDGKRLRRNDYYRAVTWRELPLVMMLRSGIDEEASYCRNEATAGLIAEAQYVQIAKSLIALSDWRKSGVNSPGVVERLGDTVEEYIELIHRLWRAIPECVWLVHSKRKLVGGSVMIPVSAQTYEGLRSGETNDIDIVPERDLRFPSRDLFILALTDLPERSRLRMPGVKTALQIRKFLQHIAILIGPESRSTEPVRILVSVGSRNDEKIAERMGFKPLWRNLLGSNSPLYEIVIPAPEVMFADYSSAEATMATLIGTVWRLFYSD